jgi:hypothetical protein
MGNDGLREIDGEKPLGEQLLNIYCAIRSRLPHRVFIARWYPGISDGDKKTRADLRLEQFRQTVVGFGLELIDMGSQQGGTYLIHPKMYEATHHRTSSLLT